MSATPAQQKILDHVLDRTARGTCYFCRYSLGKTTEEDIERGGSTVTVPVDDEPHGETCPVRALLVENGLPGSGLRE